MSVQSVFDSLADDGVFATYDEVEQYIADRVYPKSFWLWKFERDLKFRFGGPVPKAQEPKALLPLEVEEKFKVHESMYELTLTIPSDDVYELRTGFQKFVNSAMFEVKGFIACVELTKLGLPHIHALIFSGKKYLDASKVKKIYPYRYELKRVRLPGSYYEYINKEANNPLVVDYCHKKAIPQIWEELI